MATEPVLLGDVIAELLRQYAIPLAEREKRCSKCWRGLSRCDCPDAPPTVAELLRELA